MCRAGRGATRTCSPKPGFDVDGARLLARTCSTSREERGTGRASALRSRATCARFPAKWTGRFAAVLNLFTSFGFFLDPGRRRARHPRVRARASARRRARVARRQPRRRDGEVSLARLVEVRRTERSIAHEREFDPLSGILTIRSHWSGKRGERRARAPHSALHRASRLAELCQAAGLIVEEAFDGWSSAPLSRRSSEMLLVARKSELAS